MPTPLDDKLVVAISSRALFDLEEENRVFEGGDAEGALTRGVHRELRAVRWGLVPSWSCRTRRRRGCSR